MHPEPLLRKLNLANQLTFLRLLATAFLIIAVLHHGRFDLALVLFLGAAATDLLDGLTARRFGQGTRLGAYRGPAADKLLPTTVCEFQTVIAFLLANWARRSSSLLDALVWITLALIVVSGLHYLQPTVRTVQRHAVSDREDPRAGASA